MINPRCSYLANDPILLNENVPYNGEPEAGLFQTHAGVKIADRDNISRRPDSRMRSECRGTNSRISIALSDPQVVGSIVGGGKDEDNGDDRDKKNSPPVRRSIPTTSLVPCEGNEPMSAVPTRISFVVNARLQMRKSRPVMVRKVRHTIPY
jgi:hypothetical protein